MKMGYKGTDRMIAGIVFGVITFWLFAQAIVMSDLPCRRILGFRWIR